MQTLLKDQSSITWRSPQQMTAMQAVLECQKDVVVILPTGGGKSMLAIVPSLMDKNMVTVLVLPLNSLIMDYERCLAAMHVPHQVYQSHKDLDSQNNLVIVSADKSLTSHWRTALSDLGRRKPIARIVIDEAHIPLVAKGYRKSLQHFDQVRSESVQLVLLSATLPPIFMSRLFQMYHLIPDTITCRQGTNRPELKYILEKISNASELLVRVGQIIQEAKQTPTWQPQDRGLVFAPSVDMCVELARESNWHLYVGDKQTMTATEREEAYLAWINGRGSDIMVATSAFSTGNDYPHVRIVVHMDKPYDMLDYIQGQGRAGRDGTPATCHTLVPTKSWKESNKEDETEQSNEQAILDHLYLYGTKRCLRYGITLYADGIGVGCRQQQQQQQLCIVCSQNELHQPEHIRIAKIPPRHSSSNNNNNSFAEASHQVKQLRAQRELGSLDMAERLQRSLQSLANTCCVCLIHSNTPTVTDQHNLIHCPCLEDRLCITWSEYKQWRKKLQYRKHHNKICFICHVPQINDSLHPTFTKARKGGTGRMECEHADIVAPLAFAIYHDDALRSRAEIHFEVRWPKLTVFTNWLMDVPRAGRHSNLIDLFSWYNDDKGTN